MPKDYLSASDISMIMGISRSMAYGILKRSDVPSIRIGRRILIDAQKWAKWLESQENNDGSNYE